MSVSSPLHLPDIPTTIYVRESLNVDPDSKSVLEQTELVYDQLLADRQRKLQQKIHERRRQFEDKIQELRATDAQKAAEFKRWSDAALEQLEFQCAQELRQLREDYEMKFARLQHSLTLQKSARSSTSSYGH